MHTLKKTLVLGTTSVLALSGMTVGGVALAANQDSEAADQQVAIAENHAYYKTDIVTLDAVQGDFSYTQSEVSSNEDVAAVAKGSKYLCNGQAQNANDDSTLAADWEITVQGKVKNPGSFTLTEMAASPEVQKTLLGCSCAGNPADGRATANAEVTGYPVAALLQEVGIEEGANTIVFTSADGYEVALPLKYVTQRYCPIVYDVNGSPINEVVGGKNQLWLGATSANYFARDIVSITLEERQTPPPSPSSDEARAAYQNLPNIGVLYGGSVR